MINIHLLLLLVEVVLVVVVNSGGGIFSIKQTSNTDIKKTYVHSVSPINFIANLQFSGK